MLIQIDKEKLKKTILTHGILLEHQAEETLNSFLVAMEAPDRFTTVSQPLQYKEVREPKEVEIDFYGSARFDQTLDGVSIYQSANRTGKEDLRRGELSLRVFFIGQCKGHEKSGFLLTRQIECKAVNTNLYMQKRNPDRTCWMYIPRNLVGNQVVNWGYFYQGGGDQTYPQDKRGNTNKFQRGIAQLTESLIAASQNFRQLPGFRDGDSIILCPLLVVNCPIFVLDSSGSVTEGLPWVVFHRKSTLLPDVTNTSFVVTIDSLKPFLERFIDWRTPITFPTGTEPLTTKLIEK